MNRLAVYFSKMSRFSLTVFCSAIVAALGALDYFTGDELGFFIFYMLPIVLAAWFGGMALALILSLASAAAWFFVDHFTDPLLASDIFTVWNALINLAVFIIISVIIAKIRLYQQRNKEVLEFIVHDLRSPLATISMGLEELKKMGCGGSDDRQQTVMRACRISAARMLTLVNAMLDLSKLGSGKFEIDIREVRIADLLDNVIEETSVFAEKKRVNVEKSVGAKVETIRTDRSLLARILVNLASNAIKACPPDSLVSISVVPGAKGLTKFTVLDRGPGIPKKMLNAVFDRFTQLSSGDPGAMIGSGLGLSFCKLAVEELGGRICINSKVGEWTAVSFVLPIKPHRYKYDTSECGMRP